MTTNCISTNKPRRGFTLLELLLAMSMAVLLSLSLYATLGMAFRARRTAQTTVQVTRAGTLASELILQDLQSVPPPTGVLAGPFVGTHQSMGAGDNDYLQFFTITSDGPLTRDDPLNEGIRLVEYVLRTDVNPPTLVRRVTRNHVLASVQREPVEEILCQNVRSFSLRYWDGYAWQEYWDSATLGDVLPLAVAFTIQIVDPLSPTQINGEPVRQITRIVTLPCGQEPQLTEEEVLQ